MRVSSALPPDQYVASLARKRMAAGALFRDANGRVLLVNPVYKNTWDLPGGAVEAEESPHAACRREVAEELGLDRPPGSAGRTASRIRWWGPGRISGGCPAGWCSSVALPGNDFYLFDDQLAVFLLYAGNGLATGKLRSADPADLRLCRSAFEALWKLSIPHSEYEPV